MQLGSRSQRGIEKSLLSVSSVGSEAMQPFPAVPEGVAVVVFQYPRSDRRRCTTGQTVVAPGYGRAFSILGRIGGDATSRPLNKSLRHTIFQYPRSDRRRCNVVEGSIPHTLAISFQYPRSDRRRCNEGPGTCFWCPVSLSVSSVGSEAMQLLVGGSTIGGCD